MKNTVIEIINCDCPDVEKFNKLFSIYNAHPQKNSNIAFTVNVQGFKPSSLQTLVHELKKLYEIQDLEIHIAATEKQPCTNCGRNTIQSADVNFQPNDQQEKLEGETIEGTLKKLTVNPDQTEEQGEDSEESAKKFREDYQFLADVNCPEEFKILAADKINAYRRMVNGRAVLEEAAKGENDLTEEELSIIANDVAESDELNSLIHEEFEHYKTSGEVLGKHPIFVSRVIQKEIDLMTGEKKAKRLKSLETDIRRENAKLKTAAGDDEQVTKIQKRLSRKLIEQSLLTKSIQ